VQDLLPGVRERPADILLLESGSQREALDFAVTHPLQQRFVTGAAAEQGYAANKYGGDVKDRKYKQRVEAVNLRFTPVILETWTPCLHPSQVLADVEDTAEDAPHDPEQLSDISVCTPFWRPRGHEDVSEPTPPFPEFVDMVNGVLQEPSPHAATPPRLQCEHPHPTTSFPSLDYLSSADVHTSDRVGFALR
jgi:hypothetical protein